MKTASILKFISQIKEPEKLNLERFINSHAPKQIEYIKSKADTVLAYGAKRSGKSLASCTKIILSDNVGQEKANIFLAGTSLDKIKALYWSNLRAANKRFALGWQFKWGDSLIITKKRTIQFLSLRDIPSADKGVGIQCLLALIEEPHTAREIVLKHFIENVLRPNFLNVEGAQLGLTGNPPVYEMKWLRDNFYMNEKIHRIHFRPHDNPSIPKKVLNKFLLKRPKT